MKPGLRIARVRPDAAAESVDLCVVVDVLRATTTASVLCHRLGELCLVRAPADLEHLPKRASGYALFSELSNVVCDMEKFDNSPVIARSVDLGGRMPVLVTTNGTLAVGIAAKVAREVVLAGFVNLTSVVDYIRQRAPATVSVIPAGNITKREHSIEDDGCAEAIVQRCLDSPTDLSATIAACRDEGRIVRRLANEPGLAADLDLCLAVDAIPVVPRVLGGADQRWFRVAR